MDNTNQPQSDQNLQGGGASQQPIVAKTASQIFPPNPSASDTVAPLPQSVPATPSVMPAEQTSSGLPVANTPIVPTDVDVPKTPFASDSFSLPTSQTTPVVPDAPTVPSASTVQAPLSDAANSPSVFAQQTPVEPTEQPLVPPVSQSEEGSSPRITLDDLYGPSNQEDLSAQAAPVQEDAGQTTNADTVTQPVAPEEVAPLQQSVAEPAQEVASVMPATKSTQKDEQPLESVPQQKEENGGFHFPSILKFVIGGFVLVLIGLLIVGALYFLFKGQSNTYSTSGGKVTLTYWGLWEDSNVMTPILADFQKKYPNITVTYVRQDPKQYVQRLLTRIQNGNGPDVFRMHNTWVYPLQSILLPLSASVVSPQQLDKDYPPVVKNDMVINGAVYGLPLEMDALSLFVNDDIFSHAGASVPTTWDNFITVAKALTVKDPNGHIQTAGAALGAYNNIDHAPDIMSLLFLQNSANLLKLKGSQNATDALSFYTSFAQPGGNVWDTTLDNSLLAFERGKLAMYFGYSYDIYAIQAANPALHFSVHPVPHLPGENITIASYWAEGISNRSKHPKEAMELLQFLAQKSTQEKLYTEEARSRAFGEPYARSDLAQNLQGNNLIGPIVSQFKTARSSFFVDNTYYTDYNGALDQYLGNAITSMLSGTSADSAAATLNDGVDQITSQYAAKTQQ